MENYKEKYEQALENFKRIKAANKDNKELVDFIEDKYPELIESEDERIRKALIRDIDVAMPIDTARRYISWIKKQDTKNPAWSEEDEAFFNTALWHISYSISNGESTDIHCETTDWLKSLKERIKGE